MYLRKPRVEKERCLLHKTHRTANHAAEDSQPLALSVQKDLILRRRPSTSSKVWPSCCATEITTTQVHNSRILRPFPSVADAGHLRSNIDHGSGRTRFRKNFWQACSSISSEEGVGSYALDDDASPYWPLFWSPWRYAILVSWSINRRKQKRCAQVNM